ncbi:MAG: metalloregulator ArsR/SmtB family transcription factor [Sandaracinaceae bacterium]
MAEPEVVALSQSEAERLARTFKALGDPGRLVLVSLLANEELCVHEIAERLGREQSAVSHQLRVLRDRQLVRTRREGRHIYYELADGHVRDLFEVALAHVSHTEEESR